MSTDTPRPGLHGSINHVSITVSDLPGAMKFFRPLLEFLGYTVGEIFRSRSGSDLTLNINMGNGTAINLWQAKPELAKRPFEIYAPGLHHLAFNVEKHEQVDGIHALAKKLGAEILDGPGEFPFGPGGYYAVYFLGPDRLKFEVVHMPLAEARYGEMMRAIERGSKS
jgi:glyoxylase I family protein